MSGIDAGGRSINAANPVACSTRAFGRCVCINSEVQYTYLAVIVASPATGFVTELISHVRGDSKPRGVSIGCCHSSMVVKATCRGSRLEMASQRATAVWEDWLARIQLAFASAVPPLVTVIGSSRRMEKEMTSEKCFVVGVVCTVAFIAVLLIAIAFETSIYPSLDLCSRQ